MSRYAQVRQQLKEQPARWLVTGVAGFIGSNLLEALLALDQEVVGLDNFATGYRHNIEEASAKARPGQFTFIEGDVRDLETCRRACEGVDYVLHQAALGSVPRSIDNPLASHASNLTGFVNMAVAVRDAGVRRFVYASSSSVYGDAPDLPKVEGREGKPLSPYAVTKAGMELYARTFFDHYRLPAVGLRYFNVFGRRQDPRGAYAAVIPRWIDHLLRGEPCTILGDGETSRDFCYIANVVQASILAATTTEEVGGRVYNIAKGDRTTLNELFTLLVEGLAAHAPHVAGTQAHYGDFRPGDVRHSLADISAAARDFGYDPDVDVRQGLREAMAWYVGRFEAERAAQPA